VPALAWNAAGHRLIACVAWDHLDEVTRTEVSQLLREHPDYKRWLKRAGDDEPGRVAFIEASTWADDIRKDKRFFSKSIDEPTAVLPGFPDMERHRDWHYVNRPLAPTPLHTQPVSGLLDEQLIALSRTMGSPDAPVSERSYALPWLIHLTGDAHQPLHSIIPLDATGKPDRLGVGMRVINPFNPRKSSSTLHAFWDDLPGPPWLRGERLDTACRALGSLYPHPAQTPPEQWVAESMQLARDSAHPAGNEKDPEISAEFYENAKEIANRRVTEAGYRLADLLHDLFRRK